ncbi:MAG: hypothetical protein QNK04_32390 [Myxococcota bacterium]|nr:hypothetical protein [Myxococcota bacterium]
MTNHPRSWCSLVLAIGLLGACGGDSQESADAGKETWSVEATPSPGKEGAKYQPPAMPPPAREIPSDFPEDMPRYPEADVRAARSAMGDGMSISLQSPDDVDKVAGYYADDFAAKGWATDIRRTADGHAIFAEKGDRSASALVRPGEDGQGSQVEVIVVVRR